jgi:pre-rRNA-processing protein TSR3
MNSHLIERYRKCHTAEEVQAEQEAIQAEMEEEARERKARKGKSEPIPGRSVTSADVAAEYDDGDLLRANPNHVGKEWESNVSESEEEEDEAELDDVETLISGIEQTKIHGEP